MQIYRIADMNIAAAPRYDFTRDYLKDYAVSSGTADFSVVTTDEMLKKERALAENGTREELLEVTAILRAVCGEILGRNGFFLHCSCLEFEDKAIVFTAPSGTGKSTHARLWRETLGEKVRMINDDKPLVREMPNPKKAAGEPPTAFFIYGTPWNGKHRLSNNISAPVGTVFFLKRGTDNRTEKIGGADALTMLLGQTLIPDGKENMTLLLDMLTRMIETVPMFILSCDMSPAAVSAALSAVRKHG